MAPEPCPRCQAPVYVAGRPFPTPGELCNDCWYETVLRPLLGRFAS